MPQSYASVARALAVRDMRRYFSSPIGYVFLTLFIFLSATAAFWQPRFFLNNLADLDQLNRVFLYLLLFFVPALCLGVWSDERRQGTDELLLTLPATELEVVLGKYAAAAGTYSAAIILSLTHWLVLVWLGSPDRGLLVSNYLGYWVAGVALVPVAMLGSSIAVSPTVAFLLGTLFCAVPIGLGPAARLFGESLGPHLASLGMWVHFEDFARGTISMTAVLYFASLAAIFVYANVLVLSHRRWPPRRRGAPMLLHYMLRALAVVVALPSLLVLVGAGRARLDVTSERLHSLGGDTRALIAALPADRPVRIQAFISREVPPAHVQARENLLDVLREVQALGSGKITVSVEVTQAYSERARLARERFGIGPRRSADPYTGDSVEDVYLGVAVTSGPDEQVIPFLEPGLTAEYEISRAIRVVSRTSRKRIGVVDGGLHMFGGVDFRDNQPRAAWAIVDELRKQYEVVQVTPVAASKEPVDALLIVLPNRLTQSEIDLVVEPIKRGTPAMILVDPLTATDIRLSPAAQFTTEVDPYRAPDAVRMNYGDVRKMLVDFGVDWVPARIAWDAYNPHPQMSRVPREVVFVARGNGNPAAFSPHHAATAGLQEILLLYPGYLLAADSPDFTFEPLLQTGSLSGLTSFFELVRPSPTGLVFNPSVPRETDARQLTLAAQVRSKRPSGSANGGRPIDLVVVADLDFISDYFFDIRTGAPDNPNFDNIAFFLNAVDVLAGDESFIALRSRRVRYRTLERVEAQTGGFMERRVREEQQAEQDARKALEDVRDRIKKRVAEISERRDLDEQAKQIMVGNVEETENRRLRVLEASIDLTKNARIQLSRETMEAQVRGIRGAIRAVAVLVPPVPIVLLGVVIAARRARRERDGERALRRLRGAR